MQTLSQFMRTLPALLALCLCTLHLHAQAIPANAALNDQKPGSVLFYNYVTSSASNPGGQNTDLAITNTNTSTPVTVSLFLVNASTGAVANQRFVCLTPNQTASLLASDWVAGVTGYALAVAVNSSGCPLSFNYLVGDESVKLTSKHTASLNAEAFAALYNGVLSCTTTATLAFDGLSYNQAPRALALSKVGSVMDNNQALLVINRFGGDLTTNVSPAGTFFGQLFDDTPNSFNFAFAGNAQFICPLNDSFPLIAPAFSTAIPATKYGWMQFWATNDVAILGAALNYNATATTIPAAFSGGQNLHKLTLTTASFVIPITVPPPC